MPLDMQPPWALRGLPCAPVGSAGVPAGGGRPAGATCGMHAFGALGPEAPLGTSRACPGPCVRAAVGFQPLATPQPSPFGNNHDARRTLGGPLLPSRLPR